jgi:hypothetical protein
MNLLKLFLYAVCDACECICVYACYGYFRLGKECLKHSGFCTTHTKLYGVIGADSGGTPDHMA